MTQHGKCNACRQRKIKCDEVHPTCARCRKSGRHCVYSSAKFVPQQLGGAYGWKRSAYNARDSSLAPQTEEETGVQVQPTANHRGKTSSAAVLCLRSARKAQSGTGLFQTFVPVSNGGTGGEKAPSAGEEQDQYSTTALDWSMLDPRLFTKLSTPSEMLLGRWVSLSETLCRGCDTRDVLGNWMALIPPRIGRSAAIDSALECFLDSSVAYVNPASENFAQTDKSNAKALKYIRVAIKHDKTELLHDDILLAITLLRFVEFFIRPTAGEFYHHQTGLVNLLVSVSKNGTQCSKVMQRMFFHCGAWDTMMAIVQGRDSVFDQPQWLAMTSLGYSSLDGSIPAFNFVEEYTMGHRIRFARLVRLIREASSSPYDEVIRKAATDLAAELYLNDLDQWVQDIFARGLAQAVPTMLPSYSALLPYSYDFKSLLVSAGCLEYWVTRTTTCGLVLALSAISPPMPALYQFDIESVATEDVQRAQDIAMCYEFSMKVDNSIPVNALRHINPLQKAWAAWERQDMRESESDPGSPRVQHARYMKQCCLDMANTLGAKWCLREFTSDMWERLYTMSLGAG